MERLTIECLKCGTTRIVARSPGRRLNGGDCPRCGYVGWAGAADVSEQTRRILRERPPSSRRLHAVS